MSKQQFAWRAFTAALVAAGVVLALLLLWYAVDVLLIVFGGVLLSILLRGFAHLLHRLTGLGRVWSLAVVILTLVVIMGAVGWLLAGRIASQTGEMAERLPQAAQNLSARIEQYGWGRRLLAQMPTASELLRGRGTLLQRVTGIASGVLGALVNVLLVVVIGLYFAFQPHLYAGGLIRLFPFQRRQRAREVLSTLDESLWRWLVGRLALMCINGALTAIALWLLGVPLALTLGVLTGALNFIPNFGPLIAAAPAVLVAFTQSPQQAFYVALLFIAVQTLDGYVMTPMVDRRSVELPPVLTISAQVLLGLLLGTVGVLLASPLTATALILVRELYIKDTLGDKAPKDA